MAVPTSPPPHGSAILKAHEQGGRAGASLSQESAQSITFPRDLDSHMPANLQIIRIPNFVFKGVCVFLSKKARNSYV